jgi:hypothetical protein
MDISRLVAYLDQEISISMTTRSGRIQVKTLNGDKIILQFPESDLNKMLEPRMRCVVEYSQGVQAHGVIENVCRNGNEFDVTCRLSGNPCWSLNRKQ